MLVGGIINYYLALHEAKVFVGTEISSYSLDVVAFKRFFVDKNSFFIPGKLRWVTPPGVSGNY